MITKMRSVSVPAARDTLWQQAQVLARRRGISMSKFVLDCVEKEVKRAEIPDAYLLEPDDEDLEPESVD
jgi:hypothetical protein